MMQLTDSVWAEINQGSDKDIYPYIVLTPRLTKDGFDQRDFDRWPTTEDDMQACLQYLINGGESE